MKTLLILSMLASSTFAADPPRGYERNPAAQREAERIYRRQQQREADRAAMERQLLLEYLAQIARQRRR